MRRSNRDWSEILEDQARSGKSVQKYCKEVGVHPTTFYRKRRLHASAPMVEILPEPTQESHALVVRVGKYSVAVRRGFDAVALRSILQVLGELQ